MPQNRKRKRLKQAKACKQACLFKFVLWCCKKCLEYKIKHPDNSSPTIFESNSAWPKPVFYNAKRLTIIEKSVGKPEKLIALFEKSLPKLEKSVSKSANPLSTLSKVQKIAACGDNHRQLDNCFNLQNQCYKNFTMQPHLGSYRTEKCYLRQCAANSIYIVLRFCGCQISVCGWQCQAFEKNNQ